VNLEPEGTGSETPTPLADESAEESGGADVRGTLVGATLDSIKSAAARVEVERHLGETLQRNLLPRLPEIPGLRFAARYRPGGGETEVGGDWYDAIMLRNGKLGIVIGDVVGRGVEAAARMAHLQSAARVYALEDLRPAVVLERMNGFVLEGERGGMVTLIYAIVDPDANTMRMATAGHPPPLIFRPNEEPTFAETTAASPLGVMRFPVYEESVMTLEPESTALFYTDGLVEGPELPLGEGLEDLRRVSEGTPLEPDALCHAVLGSIDARAGSRDDQALLAVQLKPAGETLDLTMPAQRDSLTSVRNAVAHWLRAADASEDEVYEMLVACGEACSNAVAHAHSAISDAQFELHARRRDAEIVITVSDTGQWRPSGQERTGRGMALMRELMDDVNIDRGPDGTTVTIRRRLRGVAASEESP
jgi:anti-sigma regulatory factor (Ser/Thr protein kinase)